MTKEQVLEQFDRYKDVSDTLRPDILKAMERYATIKQRDLLITLIATAKEDTITYDAIATALLYLNNKLKHEPG